MITRLVALFFMEIHAVATQILIGDAMETLATLPAASVHCCVTSPPYFGLRDYGVAGQIGLEVRIEDYVAKLVAVFREVRRVLRNDGTLWLNLGDSYRSATKQLLGIPWRVAFAMQADGWYLRQDIIWHKPNPMPESVRDRCTKSHEYIFLFAKSQRYFFDAEAIKEPLVYPNETRRPLGSKGAWAIDGREQRANGGGAAYEGYPSVRNKRSVWRVSTRGYKGAHFAVFPPQLIEPCIKAGTSEFGCCVSCGIPFRRTTSRTRVPTRPGTSSTKSRDPLRHVTSTATTGAEPGCKCRDTGRVPATVLDPFAGSGTTGQVAKSLGRDSILIELNPAYRPLIESRCA